MTTPKAIKWQPFGRYPLLLLLYLFMALAALLPVSANARDLPDFTKLVERNAPAVVNISTEAESQARNNRRTPEGLEEFFRRFGQPSPRTPRPSRSLGSGFIISEDGYILTNHHVVDGASEIVVRLSDRRELIAELVGSDSRADLAVLKVETDEDLPTVTIGESEPLAAGEWVLAIGSPFGFDYSVTAGIVSAKGRSLPTGAQRENYVPYIQTDVAINPGNSGGPLFNLAGEVVGINAQIFSNSGGFMGVSFAIPIDVAMEVAGQLREDGKVSRGWLGVMIQEVNRDLAESFGLDRPHGALISQVFEDTPAEEGGLRQGDIITKFNGRSIERSSELPYNVGRVKAGESAEIELVREGKRMTIDLTVGELAAVGESSPSQRLGRSSENKLGLVLRSLNDDELDRLDISGGVRVVEVDEPAAEAGIQAGDVITRFYNKGVDTPAEFEEILNDLRPGRTVPVLVLRSGNPVYLALRIPE
ncbi:MAG: DegQ family serine endoprotease [Pseudomonadota bacterium]